MKARAAAAAISRIKTFRDDRNDQPQIGNAANIRARLLAEAPARRERRTGSRLTVDG